MNSIKLRNATISNIELLKHWDKQPHIIEAKSDEDRLWEEELLKEPEWREFLIAELR